MSDDTQVDVLLGATAVKKITSLSRSTIDRGVKAGRFPPPINITPGGRVAWRQSDIQAWVADPLGWGEKIDF